MESEFEPALRTEETPEALIVIVDLPGFRKENVKVHVDNPGNLTISGERGVNEMEEMAKVGGRLEKMQRFRKVIGIPQNLNKDGRIKAKFKNQTLRISLPLHHISAQQNQDVVTTGGEPVQSAQSKDDRSCPTGQEDSIPEQSGVAQDYQRARHPEAIRQDDDKGKVGPAADELKELGEGRNAEMRKVGQDFAHAEPPISEDPHAVCGKAGAGDESQFMESKSKQDEEKPEEEKEVDKTEGEKSENEDEIPEKESQNPCSRFFITCCVVL